MQIIYRSLLISLVLLVIGGYTLARGQNLKRKPDTRSMIQKFEKDVWAAVRDKKLKLLRHIFADSYTGLFADGIYNKRKQLGFIEKINIKSYKIGSFTVRTPQDGMAVSSYTVSIKGVYKEDTFQRRHYASSTWIQSGNQWVMIQHSSVPVKK